MRKHKKWLLYALVLLGFTLRIIYLDRQSIWFDESLSVLFAILPLSDSINAMLTEGLHHSPLYYILLRPFLAGEFSEFALRYPSVVLGTLTIPLIYRLARDLYQDKTALIAPLLLAISPFHIWYSQEGRMYALLAALAVGSYLFFVRLLRRPTLFSVAGLTAISAIGFYSHHFAFLLPTTQFAYLLVTFRQNYKKLRWWAFTQLVAGLSLILWLWIVLQRDSLYASSATTKLTQFRDLYMTVWNFGSGFTGQTNAITLIIVAIYAGLLILGLTRGQSMVVIWFALPIIIVFLVSQRLPTYVDRYLIISLPPFILLVASGLSNLPKISRGPILFLLVLISISGVGRIYTEDAIHQRTDWRGLAQYLRKNASADDLIYVQHYQDLLPLQLYDPGPAQQQAAISFDRVDIPDADAYRNVWFVVAYYSDENQHSLVGPCAQETLMLGAPDRLRQWHTAQTAVKIEDFNCLRLYLYHSE